MWRKKGDAEEIQEEEEEENNITNEGRKIEEGRDRESCRRRRGD